MRVSLLLWVVLAVGGLFGALISSAFFFGFFTLGLFLILRSLRAGTESTTAPPAVGFSSSTVGITSPTVTCANCGMVLEAGATFCPRCGGRVKKG